MADKVFVLTNVRMEESGSSHLARTEIEKVLSGTSARIIEMQSEVLSANLSNSIAGIMKAVESIDQATGSYRLSKIEFSLSIDAAGQVSIVSLTSGKVQSNSGISVVFERVGDGS